MYPGFPSRRIYLALWILALMGIASMSLPANGINGEITDIIWEELDHGYSAEFRDIEFVNSTHGWVVGNNGTGMYGGIVLHTRNGGESWVLQMYNTSQIFRQVAITDDGSIWITGLGGLFYSLNGGESWNESVVVEENSGMSFVAFLNDSHGWTATMGILYHTEDRGQSWQSVPGWTFSDDHPRDMHFLSSSEAWAIGYYGIYYSSDGCVTWEQKFSRGGWALTFVNELEGWAVADEMLAHMTDGQSWSELPIPRRSLVPPPLSPYLTDVQFLDHNNGWIVGTETGVMYTPNGGIDWYDQTSQFASLDRLMAVDFINVTHGWAVGHGGTIIRTTHGNTLGTRLWTGLTDPLILSTIGLFVAIALIIASGVIVRRRLRESAYRLPELVSNSPSTEYIGCIPKCIGIP